MKKQKVLIAMSGGVDSSVSAALLLEQGYEVIGGFMKNWSDGDGTDECSWRGERRDAMRVAAKLGIEFITFDFEKEYRENVYEYMIREYEAGRTPNPDVLCNKYMKFGFLLKEAKKLECDFVATGHYARVRRNPLQLPVEKGEGYVSHLLAGVDTNKDQSYFLCRLTQDQLQHVLFPIGEFEKAEVRTRAKELELSVAEKKDSQGICFVGKVALKDFLEARLPGKKGKIVTVDGEELGEHAGYMYYTIGQRTGLGIGGGDPWYVASRNPETNELVVAHKEDDVMYKKEIACTEVVETIPGSLKAVEGKEIHARIRYRQALQECTIELKAPSSSPLKRRGQGWLHATFTNPQWAVAPGQFVAFYDGDELIGSGVIK